MTAMLRTQGGRQRTDLLSAYTQTYGAALRRAQSNIALRAAKVDAELAYRARGTFLANMNHELRTPLNAITGFAGLLMQTDPATLSREKRDEYLTYILDSADLLLSHLDTIIEVADAESGGAMLSRRAFDIRDVVVQATDPIAADDKHGLSFDLNIGEHAPLVDADPDKVAVALKHLCEYLRGLKKTPQEIRISVRAGLAGKSADFVYVALECSNTVISESDIQDALRVFEHVHEGLDRKFETHRLGLSIAKSFIELNSGKFSIKSNDGVGTLIRFSLPIASADHQRTAKMLVS